MSILTATLWDRSGCTHLTDEDSRGLESLLLPLLSRSYVVSWLSPCGLPKAGYFKRDLWKVKPWEMPDQKALLFSDRISSPPSAAVKAEALLLGAPPGHGACQPAVPMESEAGWWVPTGCRLSGTLPGRQSSWMIPSAHLAEANTGLEHFTKVACSLASLTSRFYPAPTRPTLSLGLRHMRFSCCPSAHRSLPPRSLLNPHFPSRTLSTSSGFPQNYAVPWT